VAAKYDVIFVVPRNVAPGELGVLEEESASRVFGVRFKMSATVIQFDVILATYQQVQAW
jgi:hypothetical protein